MAYKFEVQDSERLDHEPKFKREIDEIVRASSSVVSVGWREDTGYVFLGHLLETGKKVSVVEVWKKNFDDLNLSGVIKYNEDIRNFANFLPEGDCLIWQDGPEHLSMEESKALLNELKKKFKSIIIATPNGYYAQGAYLGNPAENHLSHWQLSDYHDLEFKTVIYLNGRGLIGYWHKDMVFEKVICGWESPQPQNWTGCIPIFINNINRLTTTKKLAAYFDDICDCKVFIVDNQSSYPPLLEWYDNCPYEIIKLGGNFGHHAPWTRGIVREKCGQLGSEWYCVTDSDLDLEGCPEDVLAVLIEAHKQHPGHQKIGLSLKIDDLPENGINRQEIVNWETRWWNSPTADKRLYWAALDTTFAMYNLSANNPCGTTSAMRTAPPYIARHIPWYTTPDNISVEERYYVEHALPNISTWGGKLQEVVNATK